MAMLANNHQPNLSAGDATISVGVSEAIQYFEPKPMAVSAKMDRQVLAPTNGSTFGINSQIHFEVPVGQQGMFLNTSQSYLVGTLTNTTAAAGGNNRNSFRIDNTCASFLQRVQVSNAGTILSNLDNYGPIIAALYDAQTAPDYSNTLAYAGRETAKAVIYATDARLGNLVAENNATLNFALPLTGCGLLAPAQNKYVPLFGINTPIHLDLFTVPNYSIPLINWGSDPLVQATNLGNGARTWTLTNMRYVFQTVSVDNGVISAIQAARGKNAGQLNIYTHNMYQWTNSFPRGSAGNWVLPFNYSSWESMLLFYRRTANIGSGAASSMGRIKNNLTAFSLSIGGRPFPATNVSGSNQFYMELQKALHGLHDVNMETNISRVAYELDNADPADNNYVATTPFYEAFLTGLDLCSFSHKSDVMMCGINTFGIPIYLNVEHTGGSPVDATITAVAIYSVRYYLAADGNIGIRY